MRLQLLSDLHLETESFTPTPAAGAELLVLAGDIDSSWAGLELFRDWPVPMLFVAGNHEFDEREITQTWPVLRDRCTQLGMRLLECESLVLTDTAGKRIRFVATTRWCDFDLFGPAQRERAMRAGSYFMKVMRSTRDGKPFDAAAVREEALTCGDWLSAELKRPKSGWDTTVAVTHFAPSLRSADPRYGNHRAPRASATPTTRCCHLPICGFTATCTASTTIVSSTRAVGRPGWSATRADTRARARPPRTGPSWCWRSSARSR